MKFSKRSPLLRNNMEEFNKIIGSLGEEIKEQSLENIDGGSSQICASVELSAVAVSVISGVVSKLNDVVTEKYKCGGVISATAECWGC